MNREGALELFRKACGLGGPMTLAYRVAPSGEEATFEPPGPFLFIGRNARHPEELPLNDRRVSRRHAYLQAVAGRVVVVDLESRTKTFWDDEPEARPWGWLDPGHGLRIGPYRIERTDHPPDGGLPPRQVNPFAPDGEHESTASTVAVAMPWNDVCFSEEGEPEPPAMPAPRPVFELPFRVGGVAATWEQPGLLSLVGREEYCQFVLSDPSISRHHACLVRTPLGTWVVDLGAREGVHINGVRVRWGWLAEGDLVRFGLFTLVVRYDRPPEGIHRDDVPLEAGASPTEPTEEEDEAEPTGRQGGGLALRPPSRPPGLIGTTVPSRRHRPAEPAFAERGEWEPVPGAGMGPSPYALWQQQMQLMESFHNDMTMMVQMFIAMHREFQTSVRDELKRVQKLTRELGRLNDQLGQVSATNGPVPASKATRPAAEVRPSPREPRPEPGAPPPRPVDRGRVAPPRSKPDEGPAEPAPADRPAPGPAGNPVDAPGGPTTSRESAEMYADITRRITELQRQRRGYWQRILKAING